MSTCLIAAVICNVCVREEPCSGRSEAISTCGLAFALELDVGARRRRERRYVREIRSVAAVTGLGACRSRIVVIVAAAAHRGEGECADQQNE